MLGPIFLKYLLSEIPKRPICNVGKKEKGNEGAENGKNTIFENESSTRILPELFFEAKFLATKYVYPKIIS